MWSQYHGLGHRPGLETENCGSGLGFGLTFLVLV